MDKLSQHFEKRQIDHADALIASEGAGVGSSTAYVEGLRYSVAWHCAGMPKATPERNRNTACPYEKGQPEYEAWQAGWLNGKQMARRAGLVPDSGLMHQLKRAYEPGHIEVMANRDRGTYSWEVQDDDLNTIDEGDGYPSDTLALLDALNADARASALGRVVGEIEAGRQGQGNLPARALPALERLVRVAQEHSGQSHHVRRFLLGIYNAEDWPFELNRLRALDRELKADCFAVLELDAFMPAREIHAYLTDGNAIFLQFWEREQSSNQDS